MNEYFLAVLASCKNPVWLTSINKNLNIISNL